MWPGKAIVGFGVIATSMPAFGQDAGARTLGHGGAGVADTNAPSGGAPSFAAVSLAPRYDVVGGAGLGPYSHIALTSKAFDSRTARVSMGGGYYRVWDNAPPRDAALPGWKPAGVEIEDPTVHNGVYLGFALPVLERALSFSVIPRYDWRESALTGNEGALNAGVGIAARPIVGVSIAAFAGDLFPNDYPDTARTLAIGARWDPGPYLGLGGDVEAPLTDEFAVGAFGWRAGLDAGFTEWLLVRGGYSNESGLSAAHAGVGLTSVKADVDYGARVALDGSWQHWHVLDFGVKF